MNSFRHHPDGRIWINGTIFPLSEFLIEEPGYVLPAGMLGREYDGSVDRTYNRKGEFRSGPDSVLDGYIANLATYLTNIQARKDSAVDNDYASDLATAKSKRKKAAKKEAVALYRAYEDTNLEINQTDLNTYRVALVGEKITIASEIDALTTVKEIREYQYSGWPQPA